MESIFKIKGGKVNIEIPKIENGLWNDEAVAEAVAWINYRYVVATDGSWKNAVVDGIRKTQHRQIATQQNNLLKSLNNRRQNEQR